MSRQDYEGGTTWMCSTSDIDEGDGYSDLDQHDEDHDTYGNQSEANFWGKEE